MRRTTLVRNIVLALALIGSWLAPMNAADHATSHIVQSEQREFDGVDFKGQTEFEVSDPHLLPRQLAQAAAQSGCHYERAIKDFPTRFIRMSNQRFALVYCEALFGTHKIFDLTNIRKPRVMYVPFFAINRGFGTTSGPGYVTWNKDSETLQSEIGSDVCPSSRLRHIYSLGDNAGRASDGIGFVLTHIDIQEDGCGNGEWTTLWDAPAWSKLNEPR
ncbi:hypothetical protein [Bradyrhizobium sp. STM 3557]|uniref:hypothetical protein n=1 Tax=Bradyrhizobium sp. STM 3557 TaxID=578920 RepID=UPI00388F40EC